MIAQLCEIDPALIRVSQPLQWDVFSAQGKLLLHRGSVILSASQRERLVVYDRAKLFQLCAASTPAGKGPVPVATQG